jgi:hypothetical protein
MLKYQRFSKNRDCINVTDEDDGAVVATVTRHFKWDDPGTVRFFKIEWTHPNKHTKYNYEKWLFGSSSKLVLAQIKRDMSSRYSQ